MLIVAGVSGLGFQVQVYCLAFGHIAAIAAKAYKTSDKYGTVVSQST